MLTMKPDFFDFSTIREDYDTECKSGEGKEGNGSLPKCIWETYSAMANTEGVGKGTFYYLAGEHPIKGDMIRVSDSIDRNSEHLTENSEHLDDGNSEHLEALEQIAKKITGSKKSSKELIRQLILDLCRIKALAISEMSQLLNRKEDSLRNHYINTMCDQGLLKRQYPNILNHPKQKYYTPKND